MIGRKGKHADRQRGTLHDRTMNETAMQKATDR